MRGLIGKKIGMTQIYSESGSMIPVTVIEAGPCAVTQVKSIETDGYEAVQIGYGQRKAKHSNNPLNGHFVPGFEYKQGQEFNVSLFNV